MIKRVWEASLSPTLAVEKDIVINRSKYPAYPTIMAKTTIRLRKCDTYPDDLWDSISSYHKQRSELTIINAHMLPYRSVET